MMKCIEWHYCILKSFIETRSNAWRCWYKPFCASDTRNLWIFEYLLQCNQRDCVWKPQLINCSLLMLSFLIICHAINLFWLRHPVSEDDLRYFTFDSLQSWYQIVRSVVLRILTMPQARYVVRSRSLCMFMVLHSNVKVAPKLLQTCNTYGVVLVENINNFGS